jgi:nitrogen fixation NifU-like protein
LCGSGWRQIRIWRRRRERDAGSGLRDARSRRPAAHPASRILYQPQGMFDELTDLYQQVILDHCKNPRNFHEMPGATCSAQGSNPLCGDQLKLFLTMDGDKIREASFVGSGCCISKASASLLTESVKGKTRAEVQQTFDLVHEMVTTGKVGGDVGKLAVFAGVHKFPARVKCAILSWHALIAALKGEGKPVSTESENL